MNKLITIALSLSICACGGGGGGSSGSTTGTTKTTTSAAQSSSSQASSADSVASGKVTHKDGKLDINGNYNTATANNSTPEEISISGNGNTVYIQGNLIALDVIGNDNIFEVSNGVTIQSCNIIGNNNKATKPTGLKIECKTSGTGNTGFN